MLMPKGIFLLKGIKVGILNFKLLGILHTLKKKSDKGIVDAILQGINLIDDFCDTFVYEQKEEVECRRFTSI